MSLVNGTIHKYKYNGQEQLKDLGLNVTEMTWRQYDNALGRFHGIDKLAATEPHRTPYHFAGNNPIVFSDPSGLKRQAPQMAEANRRVMRGGGGGTIFRTGTNRHEGGHWSDALNGGLFSGGGGNGIGGEAQDLTDQARKLIGSEYQKVRTMVATYDGNTFSDLGTMIATTRTIRLGIGVVDGIKEMVHLA